MPYTCHELPTKSQVLLKRCNFCFVSNPNPNELHRVSIKWHPKLLTEKHFLFDLSERLQDFCLTSDSFFFPWHQLCPGFKRYHCENIKNFSSPGRVLSSSNIQRSGVFRRSQKPTPRWTDAEGTRPAHVRCHGSENASCKMPAKSNRKYFSIWVYESLNNYYGHGIQMGRFLCLVLLIHFVILLSMYFYVVANFLYVFMQTWDYQASCFSKTLVNWE